MAVGLDAPPYSASITVQKELLPLSDVDGLTKPAFQSIVKAALDAATEEGCMVAEQGNEQSALRVQALI